MTELALLKMVHLLCLIYWLGADLGVFYSSFFVADEERGPEARIVAAKILFTLDLGPRICMPLILATGVHLAKMMAMLKFHDAVVPVTWAVCLVWLGLVLTVHFSSGEQRRALLTRIDFNLRVLVIAALLGFSLYVLFYATSTLRDWLVYKTIVLALMIFCGLMIRVKLRPFGPAFRHFAAGDHGQPHSHTVSHALTSTRPYVIVIWIGLFLNTAWSVKLL